MQIQNHNNFLLECHKEAEKLAYSEFEEELTENKDWTALEKLKAVSDANK